MTKYLLHLTAICWTGSGKSLTTRERGREMTQRITIKATRPDGVTMYWSSFGWTSNEPDALAYPSHEAAAQSINWDQPFKGLVRMGWSVEVSSNP